MSKGQKYEVEGYSEQDSQVIGRELAKMAGSGLIATLDPRVVLKTVRADPKHPLRRFFNWDVEEAAVQHWLSQTRQLIRSVRVSYLPIPKLEPARPPVVYRIDKKKTLPQYVSTGQPGGNYIDIGQAWRLDPMAYSSALDSAYNRMKNAVNTMASILARADEPPVLVEELMEGLQAAIEKYETKKTELGTKKPPKGKSPSASA